MDYRTGKCSQCGAEYKVPASFAHNAARCKKCQGVVHLSPAPGAGPGRASTPSLPAKRVVPKAEPASAPSRPAAPSPAPAKGGTLERLKGERTRPAEPAAPPRSAPGGAPQREPEAVDKGSSERERPAGRGERRHHEKKKAPVAGILSLAGLLIVAAVVLLFREQLFGGGAAGASEAAGAAPASAPGATQASPTTNAASAAPAQREPALEEGVDEPQAAAAKPAEKPKAEAKPKDPATIDLAAIPDFQPTTDTSAEEWTRMTEWAALWMDVEAGAAGNRAKLELIKQTRKAVPVILNAFKKLDFATKEGRSNGDQCQKALMQICNGTNFDWKYADEAAGRPFEHPDDVWFCKRVVELWSNSWKQAEQDIKAWIKIAKLEEKDPAEAKRLLEMFGGQSPPDAGGDDLEVD